MIASLLRRREDRLSFPKKLKYVALYSLSLCSNAYSLLCSCFSAAPAVFLHQFHLSLEVSTVKTIATTVGLVGVRRILVQ
jgi:hypothetical protein